MTSLPFGKFKGHPLSALTPQYMDWVLAQDFVTPDVKTALRTEQARRLAASPTSTAIPMIPASPMPSSDALALAVGRAVLGILSTNSDITALIGGNK
jgi:Putative quorum-sensing-regulated virulence factor